MRKGLLFREIYLARKRFIIGLVVYFLLAVIGVLIRMSMNFGNLAKMSAENYKTMDELSFYFFTLTPPLVLALSFSIAENVVDDFKSNWQRYSYTFPISSKQLALHKYMLFVSGLFIAVIISIINLALFCALCGREFDTFLLKVILMIAFVVEIIIIFETILVYKFKNLSKVQAVMSVGGAATYIAVGLSFAAWVVNFFKERGVDITNAAFDDEETGHVKPDEAEAIYAAADAIMDEFIETLGHMLDIAVTVMPFVLAALYLLGYFLIIKAIERREN